MLLALRPASSAASVRGDSWHRPATPPKALSPGTAALARPRVAEIDAGFERPLDERPALLLAEAPGVIAAVAAAVAHAAQTNPRHVEAGAAELGVFHLRSITP